MSSKDEESEAQEQHYVLTPDTLYLPVAKKEELPYIEAGIQAGFPSPAADYAVNSIDLNEMMVKNAPYTFYARVSGDSLMEDDICDGDILVVDKSLEPQHGDLAVCAIDGEFTVKYVEMRDDGIWLVPANRKFEPIHVGPDDQFVIWGIVTYSIKKHRNTHRK